MVGHMDTAPFRAHAGYNRWMNRKLYALAAELTDEERTRDLKAFFGSLSGTFNHLLFGDRIWMARFEGVAAQPPAPIDDFAELRAAREAEDERILRFVDSLTSDRLEATFEYRSLRGDPFSHPMWYAMVHFFNHQTHHRGQATTLFMQLGRDPGVTDLVAYMREGWPNA